MRNSMKWLLVAVAAVIAFVALPAGPAAAHPLGNFSVNRYAGLTVRPDRVDAVAVADVAELPTLQDPPASCAEAVSALVVTVGGTSLRWAVQESSLVFAAGASGLRTSRLECRLSAPVRVGRDARVTVTDRFRDDRIGWRELVAAGSGVRLTGSSLPSATVSDELRHYPDDLLASPMDVRSASFTATTDPGSAPGGRPAAGGSAAGGSAMGGWSAMGGGSAAGAGSGVGGGSGAASATSAGGSLAANGPLGLTGPLAGPERWLQDAVGGRRLTPLVGLLAVLLALVLGAAHAALPGHGKTVMAAYLTGRRGRTRDAVAVGATVTLTHTGGVLALGLLLTTVAGVAGEAVLGWLGFASGALVAAIGTGALVSAIRRRPSRATHHHSHSHDHDHEHSHHGSDHDRGPGRWGIAGMGVAGGLVPSPSALIVLLGAAALGRTVFGVLLVIAYGLGMAATLTAAGLLLIRLRDRLGGRLRLFTRWQAAAPPATAALIIMVGLGLAGRALSTLA